LCFHCGRRNHPNQEDSNNNHRLLQVHQEFFPEDVR